MQKKFLLIVFIFILSLLVACSSEESDGNGGNEEAVELKVNLNFSEQEMEDNPYLATVNDFKEKVEENSDGKLKLKLFFNSELGASTSEVIGGAQNGAFDMFNLVSASWSEYTDAFLPFNVPFLIPDSETSQEILNGPEGDKIKESILDETDIRVVFMVDQGPRNLINSKRPINSPDDVKGLKVRVLDNNYAISMIKEMGASTESISYSELYTAAQQGVIDGIDVSNPDTLNSKLYEVQDYLSILNTTYSPIVIGISDQAYQNLPDDLQDVFDKSAQEVEDADRDEIEEFEDEMLSELEEVMEVNELSEEQYELFQEKASPIQEQAKQDMGEEEWNKFVEEIENITNK